MGGGGGPQGGIGLLLTDSVSLGLAVMDGGKCVLLEGYGDAKGRTIAFAHLDDWVSFKLKFSSKL